MITKRGACELTSSQQLCGTVQRRRRAAWASVLSCARERRGSVGRAQRDEGAALLDGYAGLHVSLYQGASVGAAVAHELPPPRRQPPKVPPLEALLAQLAQLILLLLQVRIALGCRTIRPVL